MFASKFQPEVFDGDDRQRRDWARAFRSWAGRFFKGRLHNAMDFAEAHRDDEMKVEDMNLAGAGEAGLLRQMAAELYHILTMSIRVRALRTMLVAGDGEGFEAWRLLL